MGGVGAAGGAALAVLDVEGLGRVAELPQHTPGAHRVGTARHEHEYRLAGLEQGVLGDVGRNPASQGLRRAHPRPARTGA